MKNYQFLIFDLDNTLFDFSASEQEALTKIFEEAGLRMSPEVLETYRKGNQALWEQYEQGMISQTVLNEERFNRLFQFYEIQEKGQKADEKFRIYLAQANYLMPDAMEVLQQLKTQFQLVIATNGNAETQSLRLKEAGLADFFDFIYVSKGLHCRKPNVEFFEQILDNTPGLTLDNALMIGDSFKADIYGASRIGMDTCWYTENPQKPEELLEVEPTYHITNLTQLLEIVK